MLEYTVDTYTAGYDWAQFTIEGFQQHLQQQSPERPLNLLPLPTLQDDLFGLWVRTDNAEYFFYAPVPSPIHQLQNALHEVAHWMLDHHTVKLTTKELRDVVLTGTLPAHLMHSACQRSASHDTTYPSQEADAEQLAAMMLTRILARQTPVVTDPDLQTLLQSMDLL